MTRARRCRHEVRWGDGRLSEVFWRSVQPEPNSGCWFWLGPRKTGGPYGKTWWKGKHTSPHRKTWLALVGDVPPGLQLDHLCKNTLCCNPAHLEPVTPGENTLRGGGPSALNARKTHCKRGHELSGDNLFLQKNGKERQCKTCHRTRGKRNRQLASARTRLARIIAAGEGE